MRQQQRFCRHCNGHTLHVRQEVAQTSFFAHLVLSIVTFGIWIPIGFFLACWEIFNKLIAGWICQRCGQYN